MAVYTDITEGELGAFLKEYPVGELLSYKGIAEGSENSNFLLHTIERRLHPDALREAGRQRRPAVLPRPDGASRQARAFPARCRCTARDGAGDRHAGRPAGRRHHLPRRHVAAPADGRALPRGRQGAGRAASGRRRISRCRGRTRWPSTAGASCGTARATAPTRSSRAWPPRSTRDFADLGRQLAERPAGRRHPCRPFPRQCLLPRRPAVRPDRLLFRLQRSLRLRRRHLPQRLVLREGPRLQPDQGHGAAGRLSERAAAERRPRSRRCRCWRAARRCASC